MPKIVKQTNRVASARRDGIRFNGEEAIVQESVLDRIAPVAASKVGRLKVSFYGNPKCLGRGTPVLMFDGSIRAVEDIRPGDQLMGPDSKPRSVKSTVEGEGPLFQILPIKGDCWMCNDEHLLTLTGTVNLKGKTRDISVKDYLQEREYGVPSCDNWRMLRSDGIDFPKQQPLDIPPYLVGLWMGDGHRGGCEITNGDLTIQAYCREVAEQLGMICRITSQGNTAVIYISSKEQDAYQPGRKDCNPLRTFFKDECAAGNLKRIPQLYLTASRQERLELLAGIVDTDGKTKQYSFTSVTVTGEPYRDGLLFLVRSLGFAGYSSAPQTHVCANGKVSTYYDVSIAGDLSVLPTRRRKFPPRRQVKRVNVVGFDIEDVGIGEYFGFTLDGDGRFLLGDFTVTHNSGKTRLACTFPKPLLIIGAEDGTASVVGTKGLDFVRVNGLVEFNELVEKASERYATVVVDTATKLREIRIKELFAAIGMEMPDKKPFLYADKTWRDVWIQCSKDLRDSLGKLLDLPNHRDLNVVIIAQEQNFSPEDEGGTSSDLIRPAIGSALGKSLCMFVNAECDYVCQTFIRSEVVEKVVSIGNVKKTQRVKTGKNQYCLRVGPHEVYITGFRLPLGRGELPEAIVDPSYDKIVALIQGT